MRTKRTSVPIPKLLDTDYDEEEKTLLRPRQRAAPPVVSAYTTRVTRSVEKVDAKLIAMARGEIEPNVLVADSELPPTVPPPPSAPPSVIPLTEDDLIEVDDSWLADGIEPDPFPLK